MKAIITGVVLAGLALQMGCATSGVDRETAIGAGIGAGLGAILGNNFGGSGNDRALGAAAGALLGGMVGRQSGQRTDMQNQLNLVSQQQFMTTVWVENSNGSKTPVQLRQTEGGQFIGPRGEYYEKMPAMDQLRSIYGM